MLYAYQMQIYGFFYKSPNNPTIFHFLQKTRGHFRLSWLHNAANFKGTILIVAFPI